MKKSKLKIAKKKLIQLKKNIKNNFSIGEFLSYVYTRQHFVFVCFAFIVCVACYYLIPAQHIDLNYGTLNFTNVKEAVVGDDGKIYVNDGNRHIYAIDDKGRLEYHIDILKQQRNSKIDGICVDEKGRLFAYVTGYASGGTTIDNISICMYDEVGNFEKRLFNVDYKQEERISGNQIPLSRMAIRQNKLIFVDYEEYENIYYSVNIETGERTTLAHQKFDTPYLYQTISLDGKDGYYFVKIDGEVGYGIIGGREAVLYNYVYDINTESPSIFTISPLDGKYYCYDLHTKKAWVLDVGSGFSKAFASGTPLSGEDFTYLNVSSGRLCGSTGKDAWYVDYAGNLHTIENAELPIGRLVAYIIMNIIHVLSIFFFILMMIYTIIGIGYAYVGKNASIFYKLLMLVPVILVTITYLLFTVFHFYQEDYAQRDYQRIARNVRIVADSIDGDLLNGIYDTRFFDSEEYKTLNNQINSVFSGYTGTDSYINIEILVEGTAGDFVYIGTASQGLIVSRHETVGDIDSVSEIIAFETDSDTGVAIQHDDSVYNFYAPIFNSDGIVKGYLFASTPIEHESTIFWSTIYKLLPSLVTSIAFLAFILLTIAMLMSRNAAIAARTIKRISDGDLNARVEKITNDEIGNISSSINVMAANLQESFERNKQLTEDVRAAQREVVATFAEITEAKSGQTGQHVKRVAAYTQMLAEAAGFSEEEVERIGVASMMHDVGKLLIPSEILEKPGKLTKEEFDVVKKHCEYGEQLLHNAPGQILSYARTIALEHHERYGGGGYPNDKQGEEISPISRMVAIADVFDALVSRRSYKDAWSLQEAFDEIESQIGRQFDPQYVRLFMNNKSRVIQIFKELPD